jgi:hypothetical protein
MRSKTSSKRSYRRRKNGGGGSAFGPDAVHRVFCETVTFQVATVTADATINLDIFSELAGCTGYSEMSSVYRMVKLDKVSMVYQPVCEYATGVGINSAMYSVYDPYTNIVLPSIPYMLSNKNCLASTSNKPFTYSFKPVAMTGATGPVDLTSTISYGYFRAYLDNYSIPAPSSVVKLGQFTIKYFATFYHQTSPTPGAKEEKKDITLPITEKFNYNTRLLKLEAMLTKLSTKLDKASGDEPFEVE